MELLIHRRWRRSEEGTGIPNHRPSRADSSARHYRQSQSRCLDGDRPGYHTPLENAYSIREVQEIVAARAKGIPSGAWITTIGGPPPTHLLPPHQPPRFPTLAELH